MPLPVNLILLKMRDHPEAINEASAWFHGKWGVPVQAYLDSMRACTENKDPIPQWYIVTDGACIIAGLGVIENDFHNRADLTPNVCAVYVEKAYRNRGVAGEMLGFAVNEFHSMGIDTLYLLTDHTGFYEKYGWKFHCMVQGDGEEKPSRMYAHKFDATK